VASCLVEFVREDAGRRTGSRADARHITAPGRLLAGAQRNPLNVAFIGT
jgi:hypothetical protein